MDKLPTAELVELYVLALVAFGKLPPTAWEDFRQRLTPPEPPSDAAPGVEFAPRELPESVAAQVLRGIVRVAAENPCREAAAAQEPPDQRRQRAETAAARVAWVLGELRTLGCKLDVEIVPREAE